MKNYIVKKALCAMLCGSVSNDANKRLVIPTHWWCGQCLSPCQLGGAKTIQKLSELTV